MNTNMINLEDFASKIAPLVKTLNEDNSVYSDSLEAFENWMSDGLSIPQLNDWTRPAVTVWIEDMSTWRFDVLTNSWSEFDPGRTTFRIFRIMNNGVMGEITHDSINTSEEWFPVTCPYEAFTYIEFLIKFSKKCLISEPSQMLSADSLIRDSFVPFYRFPDDLSLNDLQNSWISTRLLRPLIDEHLEKNLKWMNAPLLKLRKAEREKKINLNSIDSSPSLAENAITHSELVRVIQDAETSRYVGMAEACDLYAKKISANDVLDPSMLYRCVETAVIYAKDTSGIFHERLKINLLLSENCFAPFFSKHVNPAGHDAICSAGVSTFLTDQSTIHKRSVETPKIVVQKRLVFESLCYRHKISEIGIQLGEFRDSSETLPNYGELTRRRIARFQTIKRIKDALPTEETEIARVTHPLPFFIEQPLLHWERATAGNRFLVGSAFLSQLLKITTLVGLEELHAVRSSIDSLMPFPAGLLEGLQAKPSLGHWSRCVDHLAKLQHYFSVWNNWISSINSERVLITRLIKLRNQLSHPDFLLDSDVLLSAEEAFTTLFDRIVPKLRIAIADVEIFLPINRTVHQNQDGGIFHRIRSKNVKSASQPFAEVEIEKLGSACSAIFDQQLFSSKGDIIVPLNHFFKIGNAKNGKTEIFIYDKDYTGAAAKMTEVGTGFSDSIPLQEGIFYF